MPIDLSALGESFRRGIGEIPPIAIALALLAGPTAALIGYRLINAARRLKMTSGVEAAPFWVCHDCRSVNDLNASRCYHCGLERDATPDIEVILDAPAGRPTTFDVPAGSPFAALGGNVDAAAARTSSPGVPVMADADWNTGVPVGPGKATHPAAVPVVAEDGEALLFADVPAADEADEDQPLSAAERHA